MTNSHIAAGLPPTVWSASREPANPAGNGDDPQQQLAWQREMERAQLSSWFKPTPQTRSEGRDALQAPAQDHPSRQHAASSPQGIHTQALQPAVSTMPWPRTPAWPPAVQQPSSPGHHSVQPQPSPSLLPAAPVTRASLIADSDSAIETRPLSHAGLRIALTGAVSAADTVAASEDSPLADDASPAAPADDHDAQAPLRLHEESTAAGQALWIAMRANDRTLAALLPQLVLDLQRAQLQQGRQLHQVVCNGRLVWRDGEFIQGVSPPDSFDSTGFKEI